MFFKGEPSREYSDEELYEHLSSASKMIVNALDGKDKSHFIDLSIDCMKDRKEILQQIRNTREY